MTLRLWSGNTGLWSDPSQWGGTLPGPADVTEFNTSSPYTVTYDTSATISAFSEGYGFGTLDIVSGLLVLTGATGPSGWGGLITQSGGALEVRSNKLSINGTLAQGGGTITADYAASVIVQDSATIAGVLTGAGALSIGGSVTLDAPVVSIGTVTGGSTGTLALGADVELTGSYIRPSGSLVLGGNTLTLAGAAALAGGSIIGPGTIDLTGPATFGGFTASGIGLNIVDTGTATANGSFGLTQSATDSGTLSVSPGAVFNLVTDSHIASSGTGVIDNAGLLVKAAGVAGARSEFDAALINTGTLRISQGTLLLNGAGSMLGGTIDIESTLEIGVAVTLDGPRFLGIGLLDFGFGGDLVLAADSAPLADVYETASNSTISLQGHTLTLQGIGALDSKLIGSGHVLVGGAYDASGLTVSGGGVVIEVVGALTQNATDSLGSGAGDDVTLQIDAFAHYDITGGNTITPSVYIAAGLNAGVNTGHVVNAGLFENTGDAGGPGDVQATFSNTATGTIVAAGGGLGLLGGLVNDGIGTIESYGTIAGGIAADSGQTGTLVIASGAALRVSGAVDAASTIAFAGADATFVVATPTLFTGVVAGFAAGDTIDFANKAINVMTVTGGTVLLQEQDGGSLTTVSQFTMPTVPGGMVLTGDGNGGTEILARSPGNTAVNPAEPPAPPEDDWKGSTGGNFGDAANWSKGAVPGSGNYANIGVNNGIVINFTGPSGGALTTTLQSFTGSPSFSQTLNIPEGSLTVDYGGGWTGPVNQTGSSRFESVTGFTFAAPTYDLGPDATMKSDAGTLSEALGDFLLQGTLTGDGVFEQSGGTLTPYPGSVINVATVVVSSGLFVPYQGETVDTDLQLKNDQLTLFDSTLTLNGEVTLGTTLSDTGTIVVAGTAEDGELDMLGTNDALEVLGTVTRSAVSFPSLTPTGLVNIAAGGTYDLLSDAATFAEAIVNAGLFEKTAGGGTATVPSPFISTGTVFISSGTLHLQSTSVDLAGTVTGSGVLDTYLYSSHDAATLEPGLLVAVPVFQAGDLVIGGDFSYGGTLTAIGTATLNGHTLDLFGDVELQGTLNGPGVVDLTRTADLTSLSALGTGVTIDDVGFMTQSADVTLGGNSTLDQAVLAIAAGHTYELLSDNNIGGRIGTVETGTIANAGLFAKIGGASGASSVVYADLVNTGTVVAAHGTLQVLGAIENDALVQVLAGASLDGGVTTKAGDAGLILLGPQGTLEVGGSVDVGQTVSYDPGGMVVLNDLAGFAGTIAGFVPSDVIDVANNAATGVSYANGVATLTVVSGGNTLDTGTIALPGLANPAGLAVASDNNTGVFLTEAACFAEGTRIDTAFGPVPVEALRLGDRVITASGCRPEVVWTGHRRVHCARHPRPWDVQPVRVAAGAFGDEAPRRDLWLSPDHAVFIDGVLIPARYLVNGATIRQETREAVTYWHVELARHDVILAEGLGCESYLDTGNRAAFANGGDAVALHPDFARGVWAAQGCAELVTQGAGLEAARSWLLERAGRLGFAVTREAELRLAVGAEEIWPTARGRWHRFVLPAGTRTARLRSRCGVPAEMGPGGGDTRVLGVAVSGLRLDGGDPALGDGWYAPEDGSWRWTDGEAEIVAAGGRVLEVEVAMTGLYWVAPGDRAAA